MNAETQRSREELRIENGEEGRQQGPWTLDFGPWTAEGKGMPTVTQHTAVSTRQSAKAQCSAALICAVRGDLLRAAAAESGPILAIELAKRNGVRGKNCEVRKRIIRFAIAHLRGPDEGLRICGNNDGYWLAQDSAEWEGYLEARKAGARFEFVRVRRMRDVTRDACNRQGKFRFRAP